MSPFGEQLARARYLLETCIKMPVMIRPLPVRRRLASAVATLLKQAGSAPRKTPE